MAGWNQALISLFRFTNTASFSVRLNGDMFMTFELIFPPKCSNLTRSSSRDKLFYRVLEPLMGSPYTATVPV